MTKRSQDAANEEIPGEQPPAASFEDSLRLSLRKTVQAIRARQQEDGSWRAACETDASLTAMHLLLTRYLNRVREKTEGDLVRFILNTQNDAGGWPAYPGGPSDLDVTLLCYAALKAAGLSSEQKELVEARETIRSLGGVAAASFYARFPLVFLGQIPIRAIPYVTPRLLVFPCRFLLNPQKMSMAVRASIVSLSFLVMKRAVRTLPAPQGIGELGGSKISWRPLPQLPEDDVSNKRPNSRGSLKSGAAIRRVLGRAVISLAGVLSRLVDKILPVSSLDRRILSWIKANLNEDGTCGAIFINAMLGLMALDNGPGEEYRTLVDRGMEGLEAWLVEDERGRWQRIARSTSNDTAYALQALLESGAPEYDPAVQKALSWLERHQARKTGDWARRVSVSSEPGGWPFGEGSDAFADCDTTAIVLQALLPLRHRCEKTLRKGIQWLLAMQDRSGGWASWDSGNKKRIFFPSEMLIPGIEDFPEEDITTRVLFVLGPTAGTVYDREGRIRRAVRRGMSFLWKKRRQDGTWYGRWVVHYAYGTAQVLQAQARCGFHHEDSRIAESVLWLESAQNADGGWGESRESYAAGKFKAGPSNPLATAMVLQGLIAAGRKDTEFVRRGLRYLLGVQKENGLWQDLHWNGVLLPGKMYVKYDLVPTCAAAVALSRFCGSYERAYRVSGA